MSVKGAKKNVTPRKATAELTESSDLFSDEPGGEFGELPKELEPALGAVARVCLRNGGYFGLSVTDDGGSLRLAVRTGKFHADKRFYKLADFTAAIAKVFTRLREP